MPHPDPDTRPLRGLLRVGLDGGEVEVLATEAGGVPFRFTDDLNWMLWFMSVVLGPGRFASTAIADLWRRPSAPAAGG